MTDNPQTFTVRVQFAIRKRGGQKLVIAPGGAETSAPVRHRVDNAMIKALARAFRWRKLLDTGVYGSIEDMAAAEKINTTHVSRLLRMTLLAPDIVEAILDGRQPAEVTLAVLMEPFEACWKEQRLRFCRHVQGIPQQGGLRPETRARLQTRDKSIKKQVRD
mgnify:CR=1 FL=1